MTELRPNAARLEELAQALTSGKYEQGHGTLRTIDDRFCCLGVACDLSAKQGEGGEWYRPLHRGGWVFNNVTNNHYPPTELMEQRYGITMAGDFKTSAVDVAAIRTKLGREEIDLGESFALNVYWDLAKLNDDGVPFDVIAEVIRQVTEKDGWVE